MSSCFKKMNKKLLHLIGMGHNLEAKSMLNPDLAKAFSNFGTLLHYAVSYNNVDITRHLIELGSDVNAIGRGGKTPLMRALDRDYRRTTRGFKEILEILLEAGASVDIADGSGNSPLQKVFKEELYDMKGIFQLFIHRVRADTSSIEELASRLVDAGCTMCHAVYLEDVQLLECMRQRGAVEVNPAHRYNTPLHIAAQLGNVGIVEWLIHNGTDVNARNAINETPLHLAAVDGNKDMLRLLLQRGADPNAECHGDWRTPLLNAVSSWQKNEERVELLLEYGATLHLSNVPGEIYAALVHRRWRIIEVLLAHLAIVCNNPQFRAETERIKNDYKTCQQKLDVVVFGTSTLFDLLSDKKDFNRLRTFVRNETFAAKVDQVCSEHELGDRYGYYHKNLMKHVAKARRIVELEDKAIPVICELFEGSYNQCFDFARKVVGYLNESDLEQLILVL